MNWSKLLRDMQNGDTEKNESLSQEQQQEFEKLKQVWDAVDSYKSSYQPNVAEGLGKLKARMQQDQPRTVTLQVRKKSSPNYWMAIAASVVLVIGVGTWFLTNRSSSEKVYLTGAGEQKQITLPDGSVVQLNEHSILTLNWSKDRKERRVAFQGEGFFDIATIPGQKFIIEGPRTSVEVLGTAFNFKDRNDGHMADVEVVHGKVKFSALDTSVIATKLERACLDRNRVYKMDVSNINDDAWLDHELSFNDTPMKEVLADLERFFGIKFKLSNSRMEDCTQTLKFETSSLDHILQQLELIYEAKIQKNNRKQYIIDGGNCDL